MSSFEHYIRLIAPVLTAVYMYICWHARRLAHNELNIRPHRRVRLLRLPIAKRIHAEGEKAMSASASQSIAAAVR